MLTSCSGVGCDIPHEKLTLLAAQASQDPEFTQANKTHPARAGKAAASGTQGDAAPGLSPGRVSPSCTRSVLGGRGTPPLLPGSCRDGPAAHIWCSDVWSLTASPQPHACPGQARGGERWCLCSRPRLENGWALILLHARLRPPSCKDLGRGAPLHRVYLLLLHGGWSPWGSFPRGLGLLCHRAQASSTGSEDAKGKDQNSAGWTRLGKQQGHLTAPPALPCQHSHWLHCRDDDGFSAVAS